MILVIDNYDSFTYNLVQYLGELGAELTVARNDKITLDEIADLAPQRIVISPGPCTPKEAGICNDVLRIFGAEKQVPILGVCLGHQCIGYTFGGKVVRAKRLMHGKTSPIEHNAEGLFYCVPRPFTAVRYHSLVVEPDSLPDSLEVTAWTYFGDEVEIMGLRHRELSIVGVQFHPESILTQHGKDILRNFIEGRADNRPEGGTPCQP